MCDHDDAVGLFMGQLLQQVDDDLAVQITSVFSFELNFYLPAINHYNYNHYCYKS